MAININLTPEEEEQLLEVSEAHGGQAGFNWLQTNGKLPPGCTTCQQSEIIQWITLMAIMREEDSSSTR